MEAVQSIKLLDLYVQVKNKRDLKFEVLVNLETDCNFKGLAANFVEHSSDRKKKQVIKLE